MLGLTYKKAGVDDTLANICSAIMAKACQQTYKNRKDKTGEIEVWEKRRPADIQECC